MVIKTQNLGSDFTSNYREDGFNRSQGFPSLAQQIRQNSKGYGNYSPSSDGYDD